MGVCVCAGKGDGKHEARTKESKWVKKKTENIFMYR